MNKSSRRSSFGRIITLVLILIIPGLLHYYLRQTGENIYKPLPFLGKVEEVATTQVQSFELRNQDNQLVRFPRQPVITVVNFMHTDCDAFGDLMTAAAAKIARKFGDHPMIELFSISLDPSDSPKVLKQYADSINIKGTKWQFLTGDLDQTSRIAREEFHLDGFYDAATGNVVHSPYFVLLDSKQQIRGYYEFHTKEEVERLIGEMILLITEDSRSQKNGDTHE